MRLFRKGRAFAVVGTYKCRAGEPRSRTRLVELLYGQLLRPDVFLFVVFRRWVRKRLDCPLNQQLLPSPANVREYSEQVHAMDDACQYSIRVVRTLHLGGPRRHAAVDHARWIVLASCRLSNFDTVLPCDPLRLN